MTIKPNFIYDNDSTLDIWEDNIERDDADITLTEKSFDVISEISEEYDKVINSGKAFFDIALDTEYVPAEIGISDLKSISVQYHCRGLKTFSEIDFKVLLINEDYKSSVNETELDLFLSEHADVFMYYAPLNNGENHLSQYFLSTLEEFVDVKEKVKELVINLYFYFSLTDLNLSLGIENLKPYYLKKEGIKRRRNYSGRISMEEEYNLERYKFHFNLRDMFGMDAGSLQSLIESCGLNTKDKTVMEQYKGKMDLGLTEQTYNFCCYALNDATVLFEIMDRKVSVYNNILTNIYGIHDVKAHFTTKNLPLTLGSTVYAMFMKYYKYVILKDNPINLLAQAKQSILNLKSGRHSLLVSALDRLNKCGNSTELAHLINNTFDSVDNPDNILNLLHVKGAFSFTPIQYASKKYIIECSNGCETLAKVSLTSGGRTVNEHPEDVTAEYGADVDKSSAYGRDLSRAHYPIGRPRFLSASSNEKSVMTLGYFIDKIAPKTGDNLWKVVASGKLSFQQDLIFSKIISFGNYVKKLADYDENVVNTFEIPGTFALLRKEIVNGAFTASLWSIIVKVASNQELSEFRNLKIESGVYWLEKDRVSSIDSLTEHFLADKGRYEFDYRLNTIKDNRTFAWYSVPIKSIIGPLIEQRAVLKPKKDPFSQAVQVGLKNIVNTLYGIICSRHFSANNVVVAEIVTSASRGDIWLMSKPLNTLLSVTDGGPFELNKVFSVKTHLTEDKHLSLPGFNSLSYYKLFGRNRFLKCHSLGDIDWAKLFEDNISPKNFPDVESLAMKHVEKFWSHYGISLNFVMEVKQLFKKASYINKAHYYFIVYSETNHSYTDVFYAIRGFREARMSNQVNNPVFGLLKQLAHYDCKDPNYSKYPLYKQGYYTEFKCLHLAGWRNSLIRTKKGFVSAYGEKVMPGDFVQKEFYYRLNNHYFPIPDQKTFLTRARRSSKYTTYRHRGESFKQRQVLFESYLLTEGIFETIELMKEDKLKTRRLKDSYFEI